MIQCPCGKLIVDSSDHRPDKGHLLADQDHRAVCDELPSDAKRLEAVETPSEAAVETGYRLVTQDLTAEGSLRDALRNLDGEFAGRWPPRPE
jgi:hypothetical protein